MNAERREEGLRWYAIYTNPKHEERASNNLESWGVPTFNPRLREGRRNQFTGAMTYISKPMFPRYIFAKFDAVQMLNKIWHTRGVDSVLCFGGGPVSIDDEIIAMLQSQVSEDGYVRLGEQLSPGDKVIITDGPLKNFAGVFERDMKDSERVMVLLTAITYQGRLCVDRDLVKRVA